MREIVLDKLGNYGMRSRLINRATYGSLQRKDIKERTLLELIRDFWAYSLTNPNILRIVKGNKIIEEALEVAEHFFSIEENKRGEALIIITPYLLQNNQNKLEEIIIKEFDINRMACIIALQNILTSGKKIRRLNEILPLLYNSIKSDDFDTAFEAVFSFAKLLAEERPEFYIKAIERDMETQMPLDKKLCTMLVISFVIDFKDDKDFDAGMCHYLADKFKIWLFNAFEEKKELYLHSLFIIGKALAKAFKKQGHKVLDEFFSKFPEYKNNAVIEMILDRMETLEQINGLLNWLKLNYNDDEIMRYAFETFKVIQKRHISASASKGFA